MRKNEIDMTRGPLFGKIFLFAVPVMASGMLQLLFNACDTIVVGQFVGDEALAAVGSVASLINLTIGLFVGTATGTNVLVAQYRGAKRDKDVEEVVHTSVLTALLFGLALTLIGELLCGQFLKWMGVPDDVIGLSERYLRIYFLGCPMMLLYNFMSAVLRAIGDTRRPLIFLTVGGVINLGLNLLLVIVFHMSVEGVAIPTVASQTVSAVMVIWCMVHDQGSTKINLKRIRIVPDKFKRILRIGIPVGLQSVAFNISNVIVQSSINSFGKLAMAGATAATNLEGFINQAMLGFDQAAISFTAQNAGAKKYSRIYGVYWRVCLLDFAFAFAIGGVMVLFGPYLLSIYTKTPESIAAGMEKMRVVMLLHFTSGLMQASSGMLKGIGSTMIPMLVTLLGTCVGRIVWISTVFQKYHTLTVLYMVYPLSWGLTALVLCIFFFIVFARFRKKHGPEEVDDP